MKLPSSLAFLAIPLALVGQLGGVSARLGGFVKGDTDDQLNTTGIFFVDEHDEHNYSHRDLSSSKGFQLKMFWEKGMRWQEKTHRRNFCAECDKYCKAGEYVRVQECDDDTQDQRFYYKDGRIRSARSHLCLTFERRIKLEPCTSKKDDSQLFDGFSKRGKFQLHPHKRNDMCMTQSHHPKGNEKLKLIPCKIAEENDKSIYDDTSRWITGRWDGHSSSGSHDWSPIDYSDVLDDGNDDNDDDWKCKGSTLKRDTRLVRRDFICTKDKKYRFGLNGSGRLVAMKKSGKKWKTYWKTHQDGKRGHHLTMQKDGNLALYPNSGKALWASDTNDDKRIELEINDDGDVELFYKGKSIWDLRKDGE